MLKLHLASIQRVRALLKRSEVWDYVVLHYEPLVRSISSHLLSVAPLAQ